MVCTLLVFAAILVRRRFRRGDDDFDAIRQAPLRQKGATSKSTAAASYPTKQLENDKHRGWSASDTASTVSVPDRTATPSSDHSRAPLGLHTAAPRDTHIPSYYGMSELTSSAPKQTTKGRSKDATRPESPPSAYLLDNFSKKESGNNTLSSYYGSLSANRPVSHAPSIVFAKSSVPSVIFAKAAPPLPSMPSSRIQQVPSTPTKSMTANLLSKPLTRNTSQRQPSSPRTAAGVQRNATARAAPGQHHRHDSSSNDGPTRMLNVGSVGANASMITHSASFGQQWSSHR